METKKQKYIKLVTPVFRAAFTDVFQPRGFEGGEPKFGITMLWDQEAQKSEEYKKLRGVVGKLMTDVKGPDPKKWGQWKNPLRDAGEKSYNGFEDGFIFATASAKADKPPQVINSKGVRLTSPTEFYAGCYAKASIAVGFFNTKGNYGVHFLLNNLMFIKDGEPLDGRSDAYADFGVDATEALASLDSSNDELGEIDF